MCESVRRKLGHTNIPCGAFRNEHQLRTLPKIFLMSIKHLHKVWNNFMFCSLLWCRKSDQFTSWFQILLDLCPTQNLTILMDLPLPQIFLKAFRRRLKSKQLACSLSPSWLFCDSVLSKSSISSAWGSPFSIDSRVWFDSRLVLQQLPQDFLGHWQVQQPLG